MVDAFWFKALGWKSDAHVSLPPSFFWRTWRISTHGRWRWHSGICLKTPLWTANPLFCIFFFVFFLLPLRASKEAQCREEEQALLVSTATQRDAVLSQGYKLFQVWSTGNYCRPTFTKCMLFCISADGLYLQKGHLWDGALWSGIAVNQTRDCWQKKKKKTTIPLHWECEGSTFPQSRLPIKEGWPFWNWAGLKQSEWQGGL